MKHLIALIIYTAALMLVAACSPESVSLRTEKQLVDTRLDIPAEEPPADQTFTWITEDGGQSQLDFNPQVDILFVTDNSDSMKSAQANLIKNLDRFTAGIVKNKMIDFHIGVISVWDSSEHYIKNKKDNFEIGELRFIKDAKGATQNRRFVTKADTRSILASTLNIGVSPYEQGGPEIEEIFSPLKAALEKTGRGAANEDFFRPEAQLVVILLTDADDSSNGISAEEMSATLTQFKGGRANKVAVYGVLVNAKDPDSAKDWSMRIHPKYNPRCFDMTQKTPKNNGTCAPIGPQKLENFIVLANQSSGITPEEIRDKYIMSILSPKFGEDLGKLGDGITVKTLEKEIFLSQRPRIENNRIMIRVHYGQQEIPVADGKSRKGWRYDAERNSIVLPGDLNYQYVEGARFTVELQPLPYSI
ncbi:MAG: hypothetical protein AAGB31_14020 [Bdellovibrio sp.]